MRSVCPLLCEESRYRWTVHPGIAEVQEMWDALLPEGHHLRSEYLGILERARPEHVSPRYLLIYDDNRPVGVAYLQWLTFDDSQYDSRLLDDTGLRYVKPLIQSSKTRILVCGNLFRVHCQGFYFQDPAYTDSIAEILRGYAQRNPERMRFSGILLKDCQHRLDPNGLYACRFRSFDEDMTMELPLRPEWQTFDDYLKDLSRKYLQRARKVRQAAQGVIRRELSLEDTRTHAERLQTLYLNITLRQPIRMGILSDAYFTEMKATLGNRFRIYGYFEGDTLVAFSTHLFHPDRSMEIHYIGMDYDANDRYKLYFNIIFDGIAAGISERCTHIELGRTAREAKASAGAVPVPIRNYVYLGRGIPALAFRFVSSWFAAQMGEDWKQRNPFREKEPFAASSLAS